MLKSKTVEKKIPATATAITGIVGGTIIAVTVPCFALISPGTGSYGFILALFSLGLGAAAVITAVSARKG